MNSGGNLLTYQELHCWQALERLGTHPHEQTGCPFWL